MMRILCVCARTAAANVVHLSMNETLVDQRDVYFLINNQHIIQQALNASCVYRLHSSIDALQKSTNTMNLVAIELVGVMWCRVAMHSMMHIFGGCVCVCVRS